VSPFGKFFMGVKFRDSLDFAVRPRLRCSPFGLTLSDSYAGVRLCARGAACVVVLGRKRYRSTREVLPQLGIHPYLPM